MVARSLLLLLLLATSPAWGAGPTYLPGPMPQLVPPPEAQPGFQPAPVPSQEIQPPRPAPPVPGEPGFSAGFSNPTPPLRSGSGYAPGSSFSDELLRRNRPGPSVAPGFAITVPLDK